MANRVLRVVAAVIERDGKYLITQRRDEAVQHLLTRALADVIGHRDVVIREGDAVPLDGDKVDGSSRDAHHRPRKLVQAACGAVYSIVPLIQRRMTGQIAGMAGAYGNVGGVLFLTVLSFVSPGMFFVAIAGVSALAFVSACFLDEPKGFMVEVDEQGNVQRIAVE